MVIYDGDFGRAGGRPLKHNPPLVVHADRVIAGPIPFQRLQVIARRDSKIGQLSGTVELKQFSQGDAGDSREATILLVTEKLFGVRVGEGLDHELGWL